MGAWDSGDEGVGFAEGRAKTCVGDPTPVTGEKAAWLIKSAAENAADMLGRTSRCCAEVGRCSLGVYAEFDGFDGELVGAALGVDLNRRHGGFVGGG